jgi:hypothetical protein
LLQSGALNTLFWLRIQSIVKEYEPSAPAPSAPAPTTTKAEKNSVGLDGERVITAWNTFKTKIPQGSYIKSPLNCKYGTGPNQCKNIQSKYLKTFIKDIGKNEAFLKEIGMDSTLPMSVTKEQKKKNSEFWEQINEIVAAQAVRTDAARKDAPRTAAPAAGTKAPDLAESDRYSQGKPKPEPRTAPPAATRTAPAAPPAPASKPKPKPEPRTEASTAPGPAPTAPAAPAAPAAGTKAAAPPVDIERYNSWLNISLKQNINDPSDCKPRTGFNSCGRNLVKDHVNLVNKQQTSTAATHSKEFWKKEAKDIQSMDNYIFKELMENETNKAFIIRKWPFKIDDILNTKKFKNHNSKTEYSILPNSCQIEGKIKKNRFVRTKLKTKINKQCKKDIAENYVSTILKTIFQNDIFNKQRKATEETISLLTKIINNNASKYHNLFWEKSHSILKENLINKINKSIQNTTQNITNALNVIGSSGSDNEKQEALNRLARVNEKINLQAQITGANNLEEEISTDDDTLNKLEQQIEQLEKQLKEMIEIANRKKVTDAAEKERLELTIKFAELLQEERANKLADDNKFINKFTRKFKKYWGYAKYIMYLFGILLFIVSIVGTASIPIIGPIAAMATTAAAKGIVDMVMKHFEERINEQMEERINEQNQEAHGNNTT